MLPPPPPEQQPVGDRDCDAVGQPERVGQQVGEQRIFGLCLRGFIDGGADMGIEITIGTLGGAKGPVDVDAESQVRDFR